MRKNKTDTQQKQKCRVIKLPCTYTPTDPKKQNKRKAKIIFLHSKEEMNDE